MGHSILRQFAFTIRILTIVLLNIIFMKFAFFGLVPAGLLLWASSCITDNCGVKNCNFRVSPDPAFQQYWNFDSGTFWVYCLNGDTQIRDTIRVVRRKLTASGPCKATGPAPCQQGFTINAIHSNRLYLRIHSCNTEITQSNRAL